MFALAMLAVGWYTRRWIREASDFLVAGREVGLLVNTFGIAAIAFAGTTIALTGSFTVQYGVWGGLTVGLIVASAYALYGLISAPYIRTCGAHTLPEWLEMRYSGSVRTVFAVATVLGLIGVMATNVTAMANVVVGFVGWSLPLTVSMIFLLFILFSYLGGFWAITITDVLQMILGFVILPVVALGLVSTLGGLPWLREQLAPTGSNIWTTGVEGLSLPILSLQYPSVLTMAVLFSVFLVWGNNYYWLRVSSSRSERVARNSYLWSVPIQIFILSLISLISIYALAASSESFPPSGEVDPTAAYGISLQQLPSLLAALGLLAALAASISTATTATIGATSTVVRDLYQRLLRPEAAQSELVAPSRVALLVVGGLTWLLAFYPGGPVYLFAFATAWLGPPAVLLLLGAWWPRMTTPAALYSAVAGMSVMMILTLLGLTGVWSVDQYTHMGIIGFAVTVILAVSISLFTRPKYYGDPSWRPGAVGGAAGVAADGSVDSLDEDALRVLESIRDGYRTMAEITDLSGWDSRRTNAVVEKLDQNGMIVRRGLTGRNFYVFDLPPGTQGLLEDRAGPVSASAPDELTATDLALLGHTEGDEIALEQFAREQGYNQLQISAMLSKLARLGYVREGGLFRRVVSLESTGRSVLEKHRQSVG